MQTITTYTIVTSGDENAFAKTIQELIKEGWQPYRQHSATLYWSRNPDSNYIAFSQAMVKYAAGVPQK
ncbi:MAG TPA: DUF1737 domain-containing protein [Chitinophagaceae bacterium]|nr:DUF1737 domain-containing protein [Chitinophagaceae bacterium]